jgi:predicted O-linked N-acetylglucosamine transferase (SPINDLY family)
MNTHFPPIILEMIQIIKENKLPQNADVINKVLDEDIKNIESLIKLGISCAQANKLNDALLIFTTLSTRVKNDIKIFYNLGLIYALMGNHLQAVQAYNSALQINPEDVETLINKGSSCNDLKDYVQALESLRKAIHLKPQIPEAWSNMGIALNHLQQYEESVHAYNEAIKLHLDYFEAWLNKIVPLNQLKRHSEALEASDKALTLKHDHAEVWVNKGNTLHQLKRYEEALAHYDRSIDLKPDYVEAWLNKGVTLNELKRYEEALAHYDHSLSLKPDYAEAWSNKGVTLNELKRYEDALVYYDKAIALKAESTEVWSNKGITLNELKRYEEAIMHYEKAIELNSEIDWAHGDLLHIKMKICDWSQFEESQKKLVETISSGREVADPFTILTLQDDPFLNKLCCEIYIKDKFPVNSGLGAITKAPRGEKIRIGYFSADFKKHPIAFLTAELFELHDRNQFEIIAFSFNSEVPSPIRTRLKQSFDRFIDVNGMSDKQIAELARKQGIDIAVDLGGFTQNCRTGIFAYRAAPIQVNYLGYPGTMAAEYMDYLIADKVLIPEQSQGAYSEKIVYLPHSYQVNDRQRVISDKVFTRTELGLPEQGFVFCCFNNNFKILPAMFESWMRILTAVEGSVLWLYQDNESAADNLQKEASARGIDPTRIIFAKRMSLEEHLARHRQADLFLDAFPYNAHTTASDALWAGLPVLTLMGQSFASRVAASLLTAIGLPELITTTPAAYEALAIELAKNPEQLTALKQKLSSNRLTTPLFDTPQFTQDLERAYMQMYERHQVGLGLEHIIDNG